MNTLIFNTPEEMKDYLTEGRAIYNAVTEQYVFSYNEEDAFAVYDIDRKKAENLKKLSKETGDGWAVFLGAGGSIYDTLRQRMEFCRENYLSSAWEMVV